MIAVGAEAQRVSSIRRDPQPALAKHVIGSPGGYYLCLGKQSVAAACAASCVWRRSRRVARRSEGEGRGIIRSVTELPKLTALGIELRASSAVAAPISATDGSFRKPLLRVEYTLDPQDVAANQRAVAESVRQLVAHFKWKGAVGCSISRTSCELLGVDASAFGTMETGARKLLSEALVGKTSSVHAMVHTTVVGYNHLVWGSAAQEEGWAQQVVLVATLGRNISAVVFNRGRRVRRAEWCKFAQQAEGANEHTCPPQIHELAATKSFGRPPSLSSPDWGEWAETVDQNLLQLLQDVPMLDRLVIVPTTQNDKELESLKPELQSTFKAAAARGCEVSLVPQGEESMVRGAATSALIELKADQMLSELREVLSHGSSLQSLSDDQLHDIFDRLDTNGDGLLQVEELQQGLEMLGIQREMPELLAELGIAEGPVLLEEFMPWWHQNVRSARIVTLSSSQAWKRLLHMAPPEGYGDLILLEVTFTYCRACKSFEKKLRRLAEEYSQVRFVQLVGNGTIGAMKFVQEELKCAGSPSFFLFRRGGDLLDSWHGANENKLKEHLAPYYD